MAPPKGKIKKVVKQRKKTPTNHLKVLEQWMKIIRSWGLTPAMLGTYFVQEAGKNPAKYGGFSKSEISSMLNGNNEGKVVRFKNLLKSVFAYNFDQGARKAQNKSDFCIERIRYIRELHESKANISFTYKINAGKAEIFSGIYIGAVIDPDDHAIAVPYICEIRDTGVVELKSLGDYYRQGFILSWENNFVYLLVDTDAQTKIKEPELYLTRVPEGAGAENGIRVSRFAMSGVWLTRKKRAIHGTTVLVRQSFNTTSILNRKEDKQLIGKGLKNISDVFIKRIMTNPRYKKFVEDIKSDKKLDIFYSDFDSYFATSF